MNKPLIISLCMVPALLWHFVTRKFSPESELRVATPLFGGISTYSRRMRGQPIKRAVFFAKIVKIRLYLRSRAGCTFDEIVRFAFDAHDCSSRLPTARRNLLATHGSGPTRSAPTRPFAEIQVPIIVEV